MCLNESNTSCCTQLGKESSKYAQGLSDLAECYREEDKLSAAEPLYKQSLAIQEKAHGETGPDFAITLNNLGTLALVQGAYDRAAALGEEALTLLRKLKPHLLIVDLGLKGPSGLELTKSVRVEFPKMPVLVLSMHDEPTYAVRSLRAGANGYVTKQDALGSVLIAVREVIDGRVYLSPSMASEVISNVVLSKREPGGNPRCSPR